MSWGASGRRRVALAFVPIAVVLAVGVGAVIQDHGRGDDGLLNTATRGTGLDVGSPPPSTEVKADAPTPPSPDAAAAAVNAAVAAAALAPATPPPAMADPPVAVPELPSLPGITTPAEDGPATVTLVNAFPGAVTLSLNGQWYSLAEGQRQGPIEVVPGANGNDTVELYTLADRTCGTGDADGYFQAGLAYVFTVVASQGNCQDGPGPRFDVTAA